MKKIARLLLSLSISVFWFNALGVPPTHAQAIRQLSLPTKNWFMEISLVGFEITNEEIGRDGQSYRMSATVQEPTGRINTFCRLDVRMDPSQASGDAAQMREFLLNSILPKNHQTGGMTSGRIKTFDYSGVPASRYDSTNLLNPKIPLKIPYENTEAYWVKDDVWILVRLVTVPECDDAVKRFPSLIGSVKLVDISDKPTTSLNYYQRGRALFLQKQYSKAIEPLALALKLEQRQRNLAVATWRGLIQDLTSCYATTLDSESARATLAYGIEKDPSFPMFHLGLARLYSAMGDLDNTIASLQRAYLNKTNYTDSWDHVRKLPDPLFDDAFLKFRNNENFRKAVKEMKK